MDRRLAFAVGFAAGAALALGRFAPSDGPALASVVTAVTMAPREPHTAAACDLLISKGASGHFRKGLRPPVSDVLVMRLLASAVPLIPSFRWPVAGEVSSCYGERWGRIHVGVDIAAPDGVPVLASRAGRVIFSGSMPGYGNLILIDHFDGWYTVYGHNQRHLVEATGDGRALVHAGQPIALVGRTGNATGPHCHFEIRKGIDAQDPLPILAHAPRS